MSASPRAAVFRPVWIWIATVATALLGLAAVPVWPYLHWQSDVDAVPTVSVRRAQLDAVVSASGRVESSQSTEIRCQLERLEGAGSGGLSAGGVSTIVTLIPEGTTVKQGDVLCELDASEYQELVRRQTITVQQARATHREAELDLEAARIELEAFEQGEARQNEQLYQSQIALLRSDLVRATDRWNWTKRMRGKGYASALQVGTQEQTMRRTEATLAQVEREFGLYQRFTVPKTLRILKSDIEAAEAAFNFQDSRLRQEEERLSHYQKMVDDCTVRAPHDGYVIYANRPGRTPQVWLGAPVRQRLRLFYLPDMSKMEVGVLLHETVMERVRPGMPARITLEALPDLVVAGRVASISRLPLQDRKSETGTEVTYYLGLVELDTTPAGMRPGMSAQVEILTAREHEALVVPVTAVVQRDGQDVCYVARRDHLEQRALTLGQRSTHLQEVIDGLKEGEKVVPYAALVKGLVED